MSYEDYERRYMSRKMHDNIWYRNCNRERKEFGKWLCKEAEKSTRWWSPMRYVSEQEIKDYKKALNSPHREDPCVFIENSSGVWGSWTLYLPGFYRIEERKKPRDHWRCRASANGFPEHQRNAIVKWFEWVYGEKIDKFLDHFIGIEKQKEEEERKRWLKESEERQKQRHKEIKILERKYRTRGVTPDVETTAFFQALATGGIIK